MVLQRQGSETGSRITEKDGNYKDHNLERPLNRLVFREGRKGVEDGALTAGSKDVREWDERKEEESYFSHEYVKGEQVDDAHGYN
jgi:hypothetical protein